MAARLAPLAVIAHLLGPLIQHTALNARPRAHIDAELFAPPPRHQIGHGGKTAEKTVQHGRGLTTQHIQRRLDRIGEIKGKSRPGQCRYDQPGQMLDPLAPNLIPGPGAMIQLLAVIGIALGPAFDADEQIGPHRLRTGKAAPDPSIQAGGQEQPQRRHHQHRHQEIKVLRPQLGPEQIGPHLGKAEQQGLVGQVRPPVPAQPGSDGGQGHQA